MRTEPLSYAIRPRVFAGYLGELCLVLGALTAIPLLVAWAYGETTAAWRYLAVVVALGGGGAVLARIPRERALQTNEGMALTAAAFLIAPLTMAWPLAASGLAWEDAFFEAVSGITTTGLSTVANPSAMPVPFLFARAWMQWYGGLGIVVLTLAFVVDAGLVAKGFAARDARRDDLAGGTRAYARRVAVVYVSLTAAAVAVLVALGLPASHAALYALAAVSTGGFSPLDSSIAELDGLQRSAVIVFCIAGAVAFTLYYALRERPRGLRLDLLQLATLLGLAVATGCLIAYAGGRTPPDALDTALLALSAQTTAGFSGVDVAGLDDAAKLALLPSMLIGGSASSTAGGFKVLRLLVLARLLQLAIERARSAPHAVVSPRLAGRPLEERDVVSALLVILLYLAIVPLSWFPFVALGYAPLDALFEVVSATGTVGLSTGIAAAELPALLKAVLCIDMLAGRLEIVAWLVFLHPRNWFGRRLPA